MIITMIKKVIHPFRLGSLILAYALGSGLVQYVDDIRDWSSVFLGLLFLIMVTLSVELLQYLHQLRVVRNWPEGMPLEEVKQLRLVLVITSATLITAATSIFTDWMVRGILWGGLAVLILAFIAAGVFYYLTQCVDRLGWIQIFAEVLFFVVLPPAVAYFIQADHPHRFLMMIVIWLMMPFLSYRLLSQLKNFKQEQSSHHFTLIKQIGWEHVMVFHNLLILISFLLLALMGLFGFPWLMLWRVFLTIPIGLVEIWLMENVRRGSKPLWQVMQLATATIFLFPILIFSFEFWIR